MFKSNMSKENSNSQNIDPLEYVEQEFGKFTLAASSYPYEYICDNYQNYISILNSDKSNKCIVQLLNNGFANCCIWDNSQMNKHFRQVYAAILTLKESKNKS